MFSTIQEAFSKIEEEINQINIQHIRSRVKLVNERIIEIES